MKWLGVFLLILFNLLFPSPVAAQGEFKTDFKTAYVVFENGAAHVTQEITLTNNFSTIYAASYSLLLRGDRIENVQAKQNGEPIPVTVDNKEDVTKIQVQFPDAVVGKGKSRVFTIEYDLLQFASKNGEVWELYLPAIPEDASINNYTLSLSVPRSFGKPAYVSPDPSAKTQNSKFWVLSFSKEQLKNGVSATFGDFQVFQFRLNYHLLNPHNQLGQTSIAIPPDTAFQRVYYSKIEPQPEDIFLDDDGNWMAQYILAPKQTLNIQVEGAVQIFAKPQDRYWAPSPKEKDHYLNSTEFWQANNSEIIRLARQLKTPQKIYEYVVKNLRYDYSRVQKGIERFGAIKALSKPNNAVCMEFTDLFIALARAAGIPAREINGYAYTEDPELQPLSLVADVLHAWPEYWDEEGGFWKPVDPTWGNTTGGIDYFNKFDLSHVVFAIHGKNSKFPLPAGSYKLAVSPQKDVEVKFGKLPKQREFALKISIEGQKFSLPFFNSEIKVTIFNQGPTAVYKVPVAIKAEGVKLQTSDTQIIDFLAPFDKTELSVKFKIGIFNLKDKKIIITAGKQKQIYLVPAEPQILGITIIFALILGFSLLVLSVLWLKRR